MKTVISCLSVGFFIGALHFSATLQAQTPKLVQPPAIEPVVDALKTPESKSKGEDVRVFELKYAEAVSVAEQITPFVTGRVVSDPRTNQLIMSGSKSDLDVARALIEKLDIEAPKRPVANQMQSYVPAKAIGGGVGGGGFGAVHGTIQVGGGAITPGMVMTAPAAKSGATSGGESSSATVFAPAIVGDWTKAQAKAVEGQMKAIDKQIAEASAAVEQASETVKQADATLRAVDEMQKKLPESAKEGGNAEEADVAKSLKQLAETQKLAAEQQRRNAEQQRRAAEQQRRDVESGGQALQKYQQAVISATPWGMTAKASNPFNTQMSASPEAMRLQQQIDAMASDLRKLSDAGEDKLTDEQKTALDDLKKKMKGLIDQQFEMRQKVEIDELKQLRERLDRLDKEISDRSKNRESIINRQMKDLLSANRPAKVTAIGDVKVITSILDSPSGPATTIEANTIEIQSNAPEAPGAVAAPSGIPAPAAVPAPPEAVPAPAVPEAAEAPRR